MRMTKLQWIVFGLCFLSGIAGFAIGVWSSSEQVEGMEVELQASHSLWTGCRSRLARACEPCLWPRFNTKHIGMPWCENVVTAGTEPCPGPVEEQQ